MKQKQCEERTKRLRRRRARKELKRNLGKKPINEKHREKTSFNKVKYLNS